jgi:hypothetical protein
MIGRFLCRLGIHAWGACESRMQRCGRYSCRAIRDSTVLFVFVDWLMDGDRSGFRRAMAARDKREQQEEAKASAAPPLDGG